MNQIEFYKLQASGNDFVLIDKRKFFKNKDKKFLKLLAKNFCLPKKAVGADGVLFVEASKRSDFKMRIFNSDGSEAEMCGNGARCAALWSFRNSKPKRKKIKFETKAGIIQAYFENKIKYDKIGVSATIKTKVTDPFDFKKNLSVKVLGRKVKLSYINTGVPHVVVFVQGLEDIDVASIGNKIRFDKSFSPQGTNVNFVELAAKNSLKIRTYERGVEAETLACGTGSIAAALVYAYKAEVKTNFSKTVKVKTKGGEVASVSFNCHKDKIKDVYLKAKASLVYKGRFYAGLL